MEPPALSQRSGHGHRIARPNPESEWIVKETPDLRIVDDDLWLAVRDRYASVKRKSAQPGGSRRFNEFKRPKYLFARLTKCGVCGAGFIVYSRHHFGCFGTRDRGTCTNKLTIARQEVEARVLRALQDKLLRKGFFEEFCREFAKEMNRLRMEQRPGLTSAKREVERIGRRIKKLLDLMLDDAIAVDEGKAEMKALDARRKELEHSSRRRRNRHRSCTRPWPTSAARRSKNSNRRSSARTHVYKPQRCSVD